MRACAFEGRQSCDRQGVDLIYSINFENDLMPFDASPDVGAFEYQGALSD